MGIRLLLLVALIALVLLYFYGDRITRAMRSPKLRMVATVAGAIALRNFIIRRGLPMLLRVLGSLKWFR